MNKKTLKILLAALALLAAVGATVYAAGNYGSRDDPLITRSYLDEVVQPELEQELQTELETALTDTTERGVFKLLTLKTGQKVICAVGTELLPRFGEYTAYAYDAADVALVDTTAGKPVDSGTKLTANHLYMVTIRDNGLTAATDNAKVLVSGVYRIEE